MRAELLILGFLIVALVLLAMALLQTIVPIFTDALLRAF